MSPYGIDTKRLLLVEDNPRDAEYIADLLEMDEGGGGGLFHVGRLDDAPGVLAAQRIDAVLLDLQLPDASGVSGVKALRAHAPQVPIVVLTGLQDRDTAYQCIVAGAQDYLLKNELEVQELRRALAYAIARVGETSQRERADGLRETMAAIVDFSADAIISSSVDGIVDSWNRGAQRIFGYTREEALGRPVHEVMRAPDEPSAQLQTQRLQALRNGEDLPAATELIRLKRDGSPMVVSMVACVLRDALGRVDGMACICRDVTAANRRDQELRLSNAQLLTRDRQMRALAKRLEAVREEERRRISREVHDVLGHLLTGIRMDLRWVDRRLQEGVRDAERIRERIGEADALTEQTIATVQRIALELRPSALDSLGLHAAMRDEGRRFESRTGIRTQVEITASTQPSPLVSTALFRILQELLTNVARHAAAQGVSVQLREDDGDCVLTVADDGRGIAPDPWSGSTSLGLFSMRERAEALGGSFGIERRAVGGTVATVRVPLLGEAER